MARSAAYRPFMVATLASPTITAALGVDGGAIFQIAATEDLGLRPSALGIAFGLCVVSVPVQLLAARLPLWRARRNLQLFLALCAAQCVVLAGLVAFLDPGDRLAAIALGITILAEINVSVLYATSWQPLLSYGLPSGERQRVNSRGSAGAGAIKALAAVAFGAAVGGLRVAFLVAAAGGALALAASLRRVPTPVAPAPDEDDRAGRRLPVPAAMRPLFAAVGLMAMGGWPLFLVYADNVLWPTVNLGLLAAVQLLGSLAAAMAWRATEGDVGRRARWAGAVAVVSVLGLLTVTAPVDTAGEAVAVFAALLVGGTARTTVMLSLLELAHRAIDERTSVRSMTLYDVVASTSLQAGLLAAGLLVAASPDAVGWVDPYRLFLILTALSALVVLTRLGRPRPTPSPAARPSLDAV